MDNFLNEEVRPQRSKKVFIVGLLVGVVIIGIGIWLLSFRPSMEDQKAARLEGAYLEGSPEFADLTKDIAISTDADTVQSPTGFGRISMYIKGKVRNRGQHTFSTLEVNVSVIDSFNAVVKEKRVLVVPVQQQLLEPGDTIPITLTLDGFDKQDDRANIRWKVSAIKTADQPAAQ